MPRALDLLFGVGVLINVLKLSDLLLRKHQRQRVQTLMDAMTLWLDYTRPVAWFRKLVDRNEARPFIWVSVIVVLLFLGLMLLGSPDIVLFGEFGPPDSVMVATAGLFVLGLVPVLIRWIGLPVIRWIVAPGSFMQVLIRYVLSMLLLILSLGPAGPVIGVVLAIPFGIVLVVVEAVVSSFTGAEPRLDGGQIITAVLLPFAAAVQSMLVAPGLVLLTWGLLFIVDVARRLVTGLAWRVVEYNQGAWAGLTALATAAVGIVDLYLRLPLVK